MDLERLEQIHRELQSLLDEVSDLIDAAHDEEDMDVDCPPDEEWEDEPEPEPAPKKRSRRDG